MKNRLLLAVALALLTSCAGKDDNKTSAAAQTVACPTLNGSYGDPADPVYIATKVENGQYSYAVEEGGRFVPADGQTRSSPDGRSSLRVSCGNKSVEFLAKKAGEADRDMRVTDVGNDQIKIEMDGQSATLPRIRKNQPAAPVVTNQNADCPVINGKYEGKEDDGEPIEYVIATRQEGPRFAYSLAEGSNFLPADGQLLRIHTEQGDGEFRMSCGDHAIQLHMKPDGQASNDLTITDIGHNQIRLSAEGHNAVLTKK